MQTTRIPAHRHKSREPVSAKRGPGYGRPSGVTTILPEQFYAPASFATSCPEAALMCAVLEDAFYCFQKQTEMEGLGIQMTQEAKKWFFNDDFHWLFSFVSVCDVLGLEPQFIRTKLRHWSQSQLDTLQGKM